MGSVSSDRQEHYHPVTYGFIGLGNMGYGMAMNLRQKIPVASKLIICELVQERCASFVAANKSSSVAVAKTPREVAQQSVS